MENDSFVVAAFRSRQQTMQFIKLMDFRGVKARIINTPHEILIGCGLSAAFDEKYMDAAQNIITVSKPAAFVGFYLANHVGARLIIKPYIKMGP